MIVPVPAHFALGVVCAFVLWFELFVGGFGIVLWVLWW